MRRTAFLALAVLAGCGASEEYAPFAKAELEGTWELTTESGAFGEIRFVIDETWLLVYPADAEADGPVMGWPVDAHVEVEGDGACELGCVVREDGRVPWWERSHVDVDWSETQLFLEPPEPYEPLALEPLDRVDPIAAGDRASGVLASFEVPARFGRLFGEITMRFFFGRRT